jgi:hypothetical protein
MSVDGSAEDVSSDVEEESTLSTAQDQPMMPPRNAIKTMARPAY